MKPYPIARAVLTVLVILIGVAAFLVVLATGKFTDLIQGGAVIAACVAAVWVINLEYRY